MFKIHYIRQVLSAVYIYIILLLAVIISVVSNDRQKIKDRNNREKRVNKVTQTNISVAKLILNALQLFYKKQLKHLTRNDHGLVSKSLKI